MSENEASSLLSLELFLWCFALRRKKLRRADAEPLRDDAFLSSSSCKDSDKCFLHANSSSTLYNQIKTSQ